MINMYSGNSVIANLLMRFPVLIPIAVVGAGTVTAINVMTPSAQVSASKQNPPAVELKAVKRGIKES